MDICVNYEQSHDLYDVQYVHRPRTERLDSIYGAFTVNQVRGQFPAVICFSLSSSSLSETRNEAA